ncbi:toll-like receptor 4 [Haliotis rufescens]|uniref:toll-like receptor 4 n=1 Tax=Haliotis rufescens TaxID=6454 RepID=UPI00201E86AA|nr:toll-like receptor 4 [Haliotis rufescens]
MTEDRLPNLILNYDCSQPDNVTLLLPPGTNKTSPFRLFFSNLCITRLPEDICDYPNIASIRAVTGKIETIPSLSCLKNLIALVLVNQEVKSVETGVFVGLERLRYIDLAYNKIHTIEPGVFSEDLHGLMRVHLDYNELTASEAWPIRITHEFCVFGLSHNNISHFSNEENCCSSTWMSLWLRYQPRNYNVTDITCLMPAGNTVQLVRADQRLLNCQIRSPFPKIFSALLGTFAVIFVLLVALVVVFRYELMHLLHTGAKKLKRTSDEDSEYDLFVSVDGESESDRVWSKKLLNGLEQNHNLRLYFPLRDMDPGTVITDKVIKTLQRSRAAVIVLSSSYVDNPSKMFEFTETYNIMVKQRRGRVIVARLDNVTTATNGYLNAFLRLKKYIDADNCDLFEKIVHEVQEEKSQNSRSRSVSQVEIMA